MSEKSDAGHAALLSGRLVEAQELLEGALAERPDNAEIRSDLAWACYRANDFARAAELAYGVPGFEPVAAKLRSFGDEPPYQMSGPPKTELPFAMTDPLPVVQIGVEGAEIHVLIDTGAAELILDPEFAGEIGATTFGATEGTFAGGRRAPVQQGRVERLTLGQVELRRVPVNVVSVRQFSSVTGGRYRVDGIIGTSLLAQFRSTLNYPKGELVLERHEAAGASIEGAEVPFQTWLDHYMIAEGWLNRQGPLRFFVDSGLVGGAFTCPALTLQAVGLEVPEATVQPGIGGEYNMATFDIAELGLGPLRQQNLTGLYIEPAVDAPPDPGTARWDGLISHGFLRKYRWTIDAARSLFVFFEP